MADTTTDLSAFLTQAWQGLTRSGSNATLPGLVSLATITDDGPQIRQVAIRDVDGTAATVRFFTDSATPKVQEIAEIPNVGLLHWDESTQIQTRMTGTARVIDSTTTQKLWRSLPDVSRQNYGVTPIPGQPIAQDNAYERVPDEGRFCVIEITASRIDVVQLSEPTHKRAQFLAFNNWIGQWVAP